MKRVAVVGTSGSGKTTFANRLAAILGLPRIELDALLRFRSSAEADAWLGEVSR